MNYFKNLSESTQGIILMSIGVVLLLHTMGVFTVLLSNVLVILSIGLIVYGFIRADLYNRIKKMVKRS